MDRANSLPYTIRTAVQYGPSKPQDFDAPPVFTLDSSTSKGKNEDVDLKRHSKPVQILLIILRVIALFCLLYFFICSLDILASAFRLLGGKAAGKAFHDSTLLKNPIAGLMIGVLATVLLQSSSTTTSIIVAIVAGGVLEVRRAIPMIMGANIGTSVTNTIVSLGHSGNREEFTRAFAGATVHDMFNWLTVCIMLPLEIVTGCLYHLTSLMVKDLTRKNIKKIKLLKVITSPFTDLIVQVDKKAIEELATNPNATGVDLIKHHCTEENGTMHYCKHIFAQTTMSNAAVGAILLVVSLVMLIFCLVLIVKVSNSMLRGQTVQAARYIVNRNFPKPFGWLTGYVVILVGAILTILVQSSSVFTSAMTPLVGIGILDLERMFPLTLGSNIGTTFTSILAALTASQDRLHDTMQIALCHLFFNIIGIAIFYPVPFMRQIPMGLARGLGRITGQYRWFAVVYLLLMFLIVPSLVFVLSLAGLYVMLGIFVPFVLFIVAIVIINIIQVKKPKWLPKKLRNWVFLPSPLHQLSFWDGLITKGFGYLKILCSCCGKRRRKDTVGSSSKTIADAKFAQTRL